MIEREANEYLKSQISAIEGTMFLPDYLLEESWADSGRLTQDAMAEY